MITNIALDLFQAFGLYPRDLEVFSKLKDYVGPEEFQNFLDFLFEEAKKHEIFIVNLREGKKIAEELAHFTLELIVKTKAGWQLDFISPQCVVYLDPRKLYIFDKKNDYQRFLVGEGFIGNEHLVIEKIEREMIDGMIIPVFVAVDSTKYPAIVELLHKPEDFDKIKKSNFLCPLELKTNITPTEIEGILNHPSELRKLLVQAL
jgi:hypothetical protein